jgi:peptidoglycan/xylan/chitin deacetylase (PgdA/CDA1 family)
MWGALDAELDAWRAAGRTATFWWRDDDAVADTPALRRLLELRRTLDVPVTLAVIPQPAEPSLAAALAGEDGVAVVQHGWAHRNHAPEGRRKCELGTDRQVATVVAELEHGRARLDALFPGRHLPMLVPPWNRIASRVVDRLPALGYRGLSTFKARSRPEIRPGLVTANAHIDIIDWARTRAFAGIGPALDATITHLVWRRALAAGLDPDEPTGLLTHHLAHDEACWEFIAAFVTRTARHPAARWLAAADLLNPT